MTPFVLLGGGLLLALIAGRKAAAMRPTSVYSPPEAKSLVPASPVCGCSKATSPNAPPAPPAQYFAASSTVLGAAVGVAPGQKPAAIVRIA